MAFNGSGVFQRVRNWVADATAGIKIRADYHDSEDDNFAAGISNCIARDGQSVITQNIPFNSKRITGLADPVNPQDAATKGYAVAKTGDTMTGTLTINGGNLVVSTGGFSLGGNAFMADTSVKVLRLSDNPTGHFIAYDGLSIVLHGGLGSGTNGIQFQDGPATVSWASIGPTGLQTSNILAGGNLSAGGNISTGGVVTSVGYQGRHGTAGGFTGSYHNWVWTGTLNAYVDGTHVGQIAMASDYRIKKDVIDLPGMWDTVKALRPIQYTQADFNPPSYVSKAGEYLFPADDIQRWGFIAHELQETLLPSVATGQKDGEHPQSPNVFPIIAALTGALQEAMARIEALENKGS